MLAISLHHGSRDPLIPLFAEADDSESQVSSYKDLGEILVARDADRIVGHVQVVETGDPGGFEIKSIAVDEDRRSEGIGAALIKAALEHCRVRDGRSVTLATAAASIDALKFYQRNGFRLRTIIRDFYTPARGYRPLSIDGIPLLDEVILDIEL